MEWLANFVTGGELRDLRQSLENAEANGRYYLTDRDKWRTLAAQCADDLTESKGAAAEQMGQKRGELHDMREEWDAARSGLEHSEAAEKQWREQAESLEHQLTEANGLIAAKDQQLGELDARIEEMRIADLKALTTITEHEREIILEQEREILALRKEWEHSKDAMQIVIVGLRSTVQTWTDYVDKLDEQIADLKEKLEEASRNDTRDPATGQYVKRPNRGMQNKKKKRNNG